MEVTVVQCGHWEHLLMKFHQIYQKKLCHQKTLVLGIDATRRFDLLDLNHYGPRNRRGYLYTWVLIDTFSKFD